jgi:hypothetical protein
MKTIDIKHIKILAIILIVVVLYLVSEINKLKNKEDFNTESVSNLASMYKDGKLIVKEIEATGNIKCTGSLTANGNIVGKHVKSLTDVQATENVVASGDMTAKNMTASADILSKNNVRGKSVTCDTTTKTKDLEASNRLKGKYIEVRFIRPINGTAYWDDGKSMSKVMHAIQKAVPDINLGDMCPVSYHETKDKKQERSIPGFMAVNRHDKGAAHITGNLRDTQYHDYFTEDGKHKLTKAEFEKRVHTKSTNKLT